MRTLHFAFVALIALVVMFGAPAGARKPIQKMKVKEPLSGRLLKVLVETEALHRALVGVPGSDSAADKGKGKKGKKKELYSVARTVSSVGVSDQIKTLMGTLNKASKQTKLAGASEVPLNKIITAARARLRDAQSVSPQDSKRRLEYLSESMRQIIQIAQLYELNHKYKIFFCSKDRSYWIQSGSRAQHPFDLTGKLKNCGTLMR